MPLLITSGYYLPEPTEALATGVLLLAFVAAGCIYVGKFIKHIILTMFGISDDVIIKMGNEKMDGGEPQRKELYELLKANAPREKIAEKEAEIRQLFIDRKSRWKEVTGLNLAMPLGSCLAISIAFFALNSLNLSMIMGWDRIWIALLFLVIYFAFFKVSADFEERDRKVLNAVEKAKVKQNV